MTNLNENEMTVLVAVGQEIINCTSGQFGYASDMAPIDGINKAQKSGYIGQLAQKKLVWVDEEFGSFMLSDAGAEILQNAGHFTETNFDTV